MTEFSRFSLTRRMHARSGTWFWWSGTAPFQHGVALYQGANKGLMAGVNIGLDYMRYEPLDN